MRPAFTGAVPRGVHALSLAPYTDVRTALDLFRQMNDRRHTHGAVLLAQTGRVIGLRSATSREFECGALAPCIATALSHLRPPCSIDGWLDFSIASPSRKPCSTDAASRLRRRVSRSSKAKRASL